MDDIDKKLLNRIQTQFPISSRPYLDIADEMGIDESEVLDRLKRLKNEGIIRRIGGNCVPGKIGYVSTLCAARVPEEKIGHFAEIVNAYPGVTHNYTRENPFNVWFTFIAQSEAEIDASLREISEKTGVEDIINLPSERVYKVKAQFQL